MHPILEALEEYKEKNRKTIVNGGIFVDGERIQVNDWSLSIDGGLVSSHDSDCNDAFCAQCKISYEMPHEKPAVSYLFGFT